MFRKLNNCEAISIFNCFKKGPLFYFLKKYECKCTVNERYIHLILGCLT